MADKVLFIGSSHVNRLKSFMEQRGFMNFNFHPPIDCHLFGISGGRLELSSHVRRVGMEISARKPTALIIHIGGNDLDKRDATEDCCHTLCYKLVSLCSMLIQRYNLNRTTILQLMPRTRTRRVSIRVYNDLVLAFNRELKQAVMDHPRIDYWTIRDEKIEEANL
ncbi:hypothetical protein FSP39_014130 [Pinctada imbricata]|uniref:Uncharacterized protein n=1 Tax=Pinctada imbricata TaxID=66713 RepID=A0AA88XK98_PINIB|nr:hypothetical protein FSP39_014130 [Pinctada imbricata]